MNLIDLIQQASKTNTEQYAQIGTVESVEGATCVVKPLNGDAPINGVKLTAGETENGFLLVPVVGSVVVVSFTSKTRAIVSMFSEVETVAVRGDQLGGVLIADEMRTQLDRMTARIDGIVDALNESSPDSSAGAFKTSLTPLLVKVKALPVEDWENIENQNVKHG